jgi:putative hydrolase of the HAD superfamily
MHEVGAAFLLTALDRPPSPDELDAFVAAYLAEWNRGVHPIDGVVPLLERLAAERRLAIVTNTHHPSLVPDHLVTMGFDHLIEAVITSVEVGWRKPHPAIYRSALDALQVDAAACTFVGDTRGPDYIGPRSMGMRALLIDPTDAQRVADPAHRIASVLDLAERLLG